MSQRTFQLTGTITSFSGSPVVGAPCSFQPLFPSGLLGAIDGNGAVVQSAPVLFTTDSGGNLVLLDGTSPVLIDYPGDYQSAYQATQVQVTLNGQAYISPVGFSYASTIAVSSWITAPVATGLVAMRFVYERDDNTPIVGALVSVSLIAPALVVATGQQLSSSVPAQALTDSSGTATISLNPNSLLNPNNLGYGISVSAPDGGTEIIPWIAVVPPVVDVYKGAYNAGTTYHAASGASNGDVAISAGVLYRFINATPSAGHAPPNATYWVVVSGLPTDLLSAHATFSVQVGQIALTTAGLGHDANVVPISGDPVGSPVSLSDDLDNLDSRTLEALRNRGAWSSVPAYAVNDAVQQASVWYVANAPNTNQAPPNLSFWTPLATSTGGGGGGGAGLVGNGLYPKATDIRPGVLRPDGLTLDLAGDGTVSVHGATISQLTPTFLADSTAASGNFCAYPDLVTTPTKRVVLAFLDGFGDGVAGGRACVRYTDNPLAGTPTWSTRVYPFGTPASGWWNSAGGVACLPTGRLVLAMTQAEVSIQPTGNTAWFTISDDGGDTWTPPAQFPSGFTAWNYASNAHLVTSGGVILLPVYGQDSGDPGDNAHNRTGVMRSDDGGVTWTFHRISSTNNNLNETSIVELPDGTLLSRSRQDTGTPTMSIYTSVSTDVGKTWSVPTASSFVAYPGHPGALRVAGSQTALIWYRNTPSEKSVWKYSLDLGATWSAEQLYSNAIYAYGNFADYDTDQVVGAVALLSSSSVSIVNFTRFSAGQIATLASAGLELTDGIVDHHGVPKITVDGGRVGGTPSAATLIIPRSEPIVLSVTAGVPDFLTAGNDIVVA